MYRSGRLAFRSFVPLCESVGYVSKERVFSFLFTADSFFLSKASDSYRRNEKAGGKERLREGGRDGGAVEIERITRGGDDRYRSSCSSNGQERVLRFFSGKVSSILGRANYI